MIDYGKQKPNMKKIEITISRKLRVITAIISVAVLSVGFAFPMVRADQYQDQINKLNAQNNNTQQKVDELAVQANSFEGAIAELQARIDGIQKQIDKNQATSDNLKEKIRIAEIELAKQRDLLGQNIKAMYMEGQISTIEMLATSKDLSQFVDKQQYREVVESKIKAQVDKITALKVELKTERSKIDQLIKEDKLLRQSVAAQKAEQDRLLGLNQNQQNKYTQTMEQNSAKIAQLRIQQAAAYAAVTGTNGNSPVGSKIVYKNHTPGVRCGGGYPYCVYELDQWVADPSGLHLARECVHYVAWGLWEKGINVTFTPGHGSAYQWEGELSGMTKSIDNNPSGAQIVYMPIGPLGHVGMIDQDYGNGWVRVSQYNFRHGMYSTMDLKVTSNLLFFHF